MTGKGTIFVGRNELKKSEWKHLYPIKKVILVFIWLLSLLTALFSMRVLYIYICAGLPGVIVIFLGASFISIVTFKPIFNYVFVSYRCVPYFNKIFTKKELEKLFELETFSDITFMKENGMRYVDIAESEHWLRFNRQYVSKELAVLGESDCTGASRRRDTYVWIMYLTGDVVKIELNMRLSTDTGHRLDRYIWQEMGILPREIVGKEEEKLCNTLRSICQDHRQAHADISEKELLKRHIQNGGDLRRTCEDAFPIYLKRYREMLLKEGKMTFIANESDMNEMLEAVLKKKEFYQCRLYGEFTAGMMACKKLGRWALPRRADAFSFVWSIDHERCYIGMTQRRIYIITLASVDAKRIDQKLAVPIADIVKTEIKRKPRAGQTTVVLHSKDFKVKITLPDAAARTDLQGQKENVEKFCRLVSEL